MTRDVANLHGVPSDHIEWLERIAARSELPITVALGRDPGKPTVLHGWFRPARPADPVESARSFADEVGTLAQLPDREFLHVSPTRSQAPDGSLTLTFPYQSDGIRYMGCGAAVTFDASGTMRTFGVRLPSERVSPPAEADPRRAIEFVRRLVDLDDVHAEVPKPRLEALDPLAVLGDPGSAELVWVFSFTGDRPVDLVVSLNGTREIQVVTTKVGPTADTAYITPRYHLNRATGVPDFIVFEPGGLLIPEAATGNAVAVAFGFFSRHREMFGTGNPYLQLQLRDVIVDPDPNPMTHVVLDQRIGPYPVWGCQLRVHLTPELAIRSISGTYFRDPEVPLEPQVDQFAALATALGAFQGAGGTTAELAVRPVQYGGLVVLPTALVRDGQGVNHLAWWFRFPDAERFVSATTGDQVYSVLRRHDLRLLYDSGSKTAKNNKYLEDARLHLRDGVEQVPVAELDPDVRPVDDVIGSVEGFWRRLGRDGWNGRGAASIAYVDVSFDDPATTTVERNAAWDTGTSALLFSPQRTAPDIVAHECTHAVTQSTADLVYRTESGALNESFSDVFGELLSGDVAAGTKWKVGVGLGTGGGVLRDMVNPVVSRYSQYDNTGLDEGGLHRNSGIGNRAAVLLCDGDGTPNHPGIGRQRLARLYWEVLTSRLHPWSTYFDMVHNTWHAARDLAEAGRTGVLLPGQITPPQPPAFDATTPAEVLWAFRQVELDLSLLAGWFRVPGTDSTSYVFFEGTSVPENQRVSDVELILTRRRESDRRLLFQGRARVSAGGTVADQAGVIIGTITGHGVGTRNKQVNARVTTTDFSSNIEVAAVVYTTTVSTPTSPPPNDPHPSQSVAHWFDLGFGRRYGDIVYEGANLPAGCAVSDVVLELLNHDYEVQARHRFGEPPAQYGGTGAWIFSRTLGSTNLEVRVRSWHESGWAIRYRLVYWITGFSCGLPQFTLREVGPDNL